MSDTLLAIKDRFFELEQDLSRVCSAMRFELDRAEEENRRLRHEAESFNLEIFTEAEAAARFQVAKETLAEWRKKWNLPHIREGAVVRYTNSHLVRIAQILERPQLQEAQRKRA
ncbi:MAG TPA: hypothetical protein VGB17_14205 [Pyrinomonadaceae bacterium]|jgi:septation ring formation regulator EzrA